MVNSPQRAFGERIRDLRMACGMTQEDLCERCGLFRTYLSRIETGQANPTLTMIHALAVSLGVDVRVLFEPVVGQASWVETAASPAQPLAVASRPKEGKTVAAKAGRATAAKATGKLAAKHKPSRGRVSR